MRTKCVGVAGRNGAGKDAVVDYLAERCGAVIDNHADERQLHRNIEASSIREWICSPAKQGAGR